MTLATTKTTLPRTAPVRRAEIRDVAAQIAAAAKPLRIILFGSHALGNARPDSDVDLLVILDHRPAPDATLRIRRRIRYNFPLDIIVHDEKALLTRLAQGDNFLREVIDCGKVLYEKPDR